MTGKTLRIEWFTPGTIVWTFDHWEKSQDAPLRDTGLGVYLFDLPLGSVLAKSTLQFHFTWPEDPSWQSDEYQLDIKESS